MRGERGSVPNKQRVDYGRGQLDVSLYQLVLGSEGIGAVSGGEAIDCPTGFGNGISTRLRAQPV